MESIIKEYEKKIGFTPKIIGMFWDKKKLLINNIKNAIKTNTPYDEYELLTDEEKIAFDKGLLLF